MEEVFSRFLNHKIGTESHKTSHIMILRNETDAEWNIYEATVKNYFYHNKASVTKSAFNQQ